MSEDTKEGEGIDAGGWQRDAEEFGYFAGKYMAEGRVAYAVEYAVAAAHAAFQVLKRMKP